MSDFKFIQSVVANGVHQVTKYQSESTGLLLVHADVKGPMVTGLIVIGTFPEDDDGLPHTLEHLIFLGSEKYPYKGVLDTLALKCTSTGINAYTDSDHTCYSFTTAEQNGFCCFLPVYLEHVFFPTLEDGAYATEVHHIDGNGKDQGVVYSEMQAKEFDMEDIAHVELSRTIYPPTNGYHYVSGGVLKNLRDSTSNAKVKNYHSKYYSSRNAVIIVIGTIEKDKLFGCLDSFMKKLKTKGKLHEVEKVWNKETPSQTESVVRTINCPIEADSDSEDDGNKSDDDDDDDAFVTIGFRGPSVVHNLEESVALKMLCQYLTETSIAPLQQYFSEGEDQICAEVNNGEIENSEPITFLEFEGVPKEKAESIPELLKISLEQHLMDFDKARMDNCLKASIQEELSAMENNPHGSLQYACIADFLFGRSDPKMFQKRLNICSILQDLTNHTSQYWTKFIQQQILQKHWVTIITVPSTEARQNLVTAKKERRELRIKTLGQEGLNLLKEKLLEAQRKNNEPIPQEVLAGIPVPPLSAVSFHNIKRQWNPDFSKDFDCNVIIDDISSNFVYVTVHMDTTPLRRKDRKYLYLYLESLTESNVMLDNEQEMDYDDVIEGLSRDLINISRSFGINGKGFPNPCGDHNHIMCVHVQFEMDKIDLGFEWLRRILFQVNWKSNRIQTLLSRTINYVNQVKRKGCQIVKNLHQNIRFKEDSNVNCLSPIRQLGFMKQIKASLPDSESEIVSILKDIRSILTTPSNVTIQIASNLSKMKSVLVKKRVDPRLFLKKMFPFKSKTGEKKIANAPDTVWMKSEKILSPEAIIIGLTTDQSGYLYQSSKGISDYNDPKLPILNTAIEYFVQESGPFFRAIRGGGYAYSYDMFMRPSKGIIIFQLSMCASTVGSYRAAADTIRHHLDDPKAWNQDLLASAKSSLICAIIQMEDTPLRLAKQALECSYRKVPMDFSRSMIERIQAVTLDGIKTATREYIEPLFIKPTNCAIVIPTERLQIVADEFHKIGKKLTVLSSLDESSLAEWTF